MSTLLEGLDRIDDAARSSDVKTVERQYLENRMWHIRDAVQKLRTLPEVNIQAGWSRAITREELEALPPSGPDGAVERRLIMHDFQDSRVPVKHPDSLRARLVCPYCPDSFKPPTTGETIEAEPTEDPEVVAWQAFDPEEPRVGWFNLASYTSAETARNFGWKIRELVVRNAHPVRASEPVRQLLDEVATKANALPYTAPEVSEIMVAVDKLRTLLAGVPVREEPSGEGYTVEDIGEFLRSCRGLTDLEYDVAMKRIRKLRAVRDEGERIEGRAYYDDMEMVWLHWDLEDGPPPEVEHRPAVLLTEGGGDDG